MGFSKAQLQRLSLVCITQISFDENLLFQKTWECPAGHLRTPLGAQAEAKLPPGCCQMTTEHLRGCKDGPLLPNLLLESLHQLPQSSSTAQVLPITSSFFPSQLAFMSDAHRAAKALSSTLDSPSVTFTGTYHKTFHMSNHISTSS